MVSKVFEKLVNNRIVDDLEKSDLFSDFQYGFRSSGSTVDLLTVVSDRFARAFNRSEANRAVALDISKAFVMVWHAGLFHKLKSCGISGEIFGFISSFLINGRLQVVLNGKFSQEYPDNARVPQGSTLGLTLFLLYINNLGALVCSMKFLSPKVALYLYKSTIRPCMEYCCHVGAGAPSCYLELLDKLQKRICRTVGPSLPASLEPFAHCRNVANLSLFYRYYFSRFSSELAQLVPLPFS